MRKHVEMAKVLERRIMHGDYAIMKIPSERTLAEEMNVSHMTARKAVQLLIENQILIRQDNGRLAVQRHQARAGGKTNIQLAFATPAFPSREYQSWRLALERTTAGFGAKIRPVHYVHWEDPVLLESLDGFDGIFIIPDAEPVGAATLERLMNAPIPVVILGTDWTDKQIPSVVSIPIRGADKLLAYVASLGHGTIDCFNTQPQNDRNSEAIRLWESWRASHHIGGRLINEPVETYGSALDRAYEVATRLLASGQWRPEAVLCTTLDVSIAVMRALHEHKYVVGRDVSVCTFNGEGLASKLIPSLTSFQLPDLGPLLSVCVEWMIRGGRKEDWIGNLLIEVSKSELFIGESTRRRAERTSSEN